MSHALLYFKSVYL